MDAAHRAYVSSAASARKGACWPHAAQRSECGEGWTCATCGARGLPSCTSPLTLAHVAEGVQRALCAAAEEADSATAPRVGAKRPRRGGGAAQRGSEAHDADAEPPLVMDHVLWTVTRWLGDAFRKKIHGGGGGGWIPVASSAGIRVDAIVWPLMPCPPPE